MATGESPSCSTCGESISLADQQCPGCGATLGLEPTALHPALRPEAGAQVLEGKWRLDERLGKGGMGTVYRAHDLELERPVAVKMLADNLCEDAEFVQRFEREARMMARLDHPNLVPVYAVGRAGRVPFIVMKLLKGATLGETLQARGRFPMPEVLALTRQICAGLQFMHDHQVVHRDLKPANIFVAPDGHVTLLDLGVARDASSEMTRSGVMVGTPRYMAPEQILGKRADHRADLYALATVVFELMTGQPVFDAESDFSVMKAHIDQPPPDPRQYAELTDAVVAVLLRGLAKSPEARFQSAREFVSALEEATHPAPARTRVPRTSAPTGVAPARAAAPTPPATPSRPSPSSAPPGTPRPVAPASGVTEEVLALEVPRSNTPLWAALVTASIVAGGGGWYLLWGSETPGARPTPHPSPIAQAMGSESRPPAQPEPPPAAQPEPPSAAQPEPPPAAQPEPPPPSPAPGDAPQRATRSAPTRRSGPAEVRCLVTTAGEPSWAYVDVDGMRQGATPLVLKLTPGAHVLLFQRPGFAAQTRTLTVSAGETRKLQVELTP